MDKNLNSTSQKIHEVEMTPCRQNVHKRSCGISSSATGLQPDADNPSNAITPPLDLPILISSLNHQSDTLKNLTRSLRGPFHESIHDKTIGLGTTNKTQDLV